MKERILGLVGLGAMSLASLMVCAYWARMLAGATNETARDVAEYRACVWLGAFVITTTAWIWLLVKTIRHARSEQNP